MVEGSVINTDFSGILERLRGGLIVSCQARPDNPLHGPIFMTAMARAAAQGGAAGLRMNGADDIRAARAAVELPIIGIYKHPYGDNPVVITPTFDDAKLVADAGSTILAIDATSRPRPDGMPLAALIARIHNELRLPVMADVGDLHDGLAAVAAGADIVATTLSGYLDPAISSPDEPDLDLIEALAKRVTIPVIAEGRIKSPEEARAAIERGAFAVVVGTAITNPREVTRRYVEALHPS